MTPLVIGHPRRGGVSVLQAFPHLAATIAWSDHSVLVEAVADVMWFGGNTLFVDVAEEGSARAAMAHQKQVMGVPQFVVVIVDDPADREAATELACIALTSLPPSAVLVIGDAATQRAILAVTSDLELVPPLHTSLDELPAVASELVATARWESVS